MGTILSHSVRSVLMAEFRHQDLSNSQFERVRLNGSEFKAVDFTDVVVKGAIFQNFRIAAADIYDVVINGDLRNVINGDLRNVVVNGVDIAPLVEDELNRRYPERAKLRAKTPEEYVDAWDTLQRLWEGTIARARELGEEKLHESVNGEWSFIQTLRHLNFATAAWVERMALGNPTPWRPLDLPWDEAPGWDDIPWDRDAQPSLDEVLAMRADRQRTVRALVASLTPERITSNVSMTAAGWPTAESFPLRQCIAIVFNEEWEHRLYAERDLAVLEAN